MSHDTHSINEIFVLECLKVFDFFLTSRSLRNFPYPTAQMLIEMDVYYVDPPSLVSSVQAFHNN